MYQKYSIVFLPKHFFKNLGLELEHTSNADISDVYMPYGNQVWSVPLPTKLPANRQSSGN